MFVYFREYTKLSVKDQEVEFYCSVQLRSRTKKVIDSILLYLHLQFDPQFQNVQKMPHLFSMQDVCSFSLGNTLISITTISEFLPVAYYY